MDLDTYLIAVFCWIDERLPVVTGGKRRRQGGPGSVLEAREVLTIEIVGEYLRLEQDTALCAYFQRHYAHCFPAVRTVQRTTVVRQAANLCWIKARRGQQAVTQLPHDPQFALVDRFALPVCHFARATRCQRFAGQAAYGYDPLRRHTCYGLRFQARGCWPGVTTPFELAPGNLHVLAAAADLAQGTSGILRGDRHDWSPRQRDDLAERGVDVVAPDRSAKRDPPPR